MILRGGGGGGQIGPPGFWLTHPPTHIRKFFLRKKMKFIKGAQTWRSILGTQTFFWPLNPPPPPPHRYSINQPSKGLRGGAFGGLWFLCLRACPLPPPGRVSEQATPHGDFRGHVHQRHLRCRAQRGTHNAMVTGVAPQCNNGGAHAGLKHLHLDLRLGNLQSHTSKDHGPGDALRGAGGWRGLAGKRRWASLASHARVTP